MGGRTYQTLAPELEEHAEKVAADLENHGYRVSIEKKELGFPYTPTLLAKRDNTTLAVDICSSLVLTRLNAWVQYGKSCGHDLRVIVCLPGSIQPEQNDVETIRGKGIGLRLVSATGINEIVVPRDLGLNVQLPDRSSLPPKLKTLLGAAYDQFDQGAWRQGFDDACKVFEIKSRLYLKRWIKTGRIQLVSNKGPRKLTPAQIDKLTMGRLIDAFKQIAAKNQDDSQIEKTLVSLKQDRDLLTHHKHKKITETRLRNNVGRHMWAIVDALRTLIK